MHLKLYLYIMLHKISSMYTQQGHPFIPTSSSVTGRGHATCRVAPIVSEAFWYIKRTSSVGALGEKSAILMDG